MIILEAYIKIIDKMRGNLKDKMKNEKKENNKVVSVDESVQAVDKEQTTAEAPVEVTEELELSATDGEDVEGEEVELDLLDAEEEELEPELLEEEGEELEPELSEDDGEVLEPDLSAEDGEEFEEDTEEFSEEELAEKKQKRNKRLKKIGLSVVGLLAVVYLGFAFFFSSHFMFHTTINGLDYSMRSVEDIEESMERQVASYKLVLEEADGSATAIKGADIDLVYVKGEELTELVKAQNNFLWPVSLWQNQEIEAAVGVSYDEAKLEELLNGLKMMQAENQVAPVSAYPEYDGEKFSVKEEDLGSQLIADVFKEKVAEYISGFQKSLNMVEEGCYVEPKYYSDAPEVIAACDTMNEYLGASITYTFGDATEVVDGSIISQWLTTDENMAVTYNEEGVAQYIADLAKKYDTYRTDRTFTSGNGNTVTVSGGNYGWRMDQATEIEALKASIANKEVITKEPAYLQTAATHNSPDWGNTYVEVDLTNQYVYLFVNGSLVTSAPCVTGKPSTGCATPQGSYYIKFKSMNVTLRGPKQEDGTYEWESPVTFWMPFNGGIGLHDASWQYAFGDPKGYLYAGSKGCVNLQYSVAQTIYNNVSAGTPVICHY